MLYRITRHSIVIAMACTGDKGGDSSSPEDTQSEEGGLPLSMTYVDGFSQAALAGAEVCVLEPEIAGESCFISDEDGVIEWTWSEPDVTNFLSRLTLEDYLTSLYTGRYNDEVRVIWEGMIEATGSVEITQFAYSETATAILLDGGGVTQEKGLGHVLYGLASMDGSSMEGAVATLLDASGASVGTVLYVDEGATGLDATLVGTSVSGGIAVVNVVPGTYTLSLTSPDFTCREGVSWHSSEENQSPLPVEANSLTLGTLSCQAL